MLQNLSPLDSPKLKSYAFLIAVDIEAEKITTDAVAAKLADALTWVEHIGDIDVTCLGEIEVEEEPDRFALNENIAGEPV